MESSEDRIGRIRRMQEKKGEEHGDYSPGLDQRKMLDEAGMEEVDASWYYGSSSKFLDFWYNEMAEVRPSMRPSQREELDLLYKTLDKKIREEQEAMEEALRRNQELYEGMEEFNAIVREYFPLPGDKR